MYEAHFGLKSRPFGSKADGAGVFVGPQQAKTMTSLNKGLAAVDAVVTVTGPAGVGKTTIVERALEQISPGRTAARIGRMQLSPQEAQELLFGGFGIKKQSQGTIRRFAAFRQLLAVQAAADARVALVIEDAERIGIDTLAELEAITAADTGDGTGANIILMGQPSLAKILMQPELARLNQRVRLRAKIEPLGNSELQAYLKHAMRHAGGDFDQIFEPGVVEIVFECSQGIPRVINTLCEMAMTNAMEDGASRVSAALMHQVAVDAFGHEGPAPEASPAPAVSTAEEAEPQASNIEASGDCEPARAPDAGTAQPAGTGAARSKAFDTAPIAAKSIEEIENAREDELPPAARNIVVESGRYPERPEAVVGSPLNDGDLSGPADTASAPDPQSDPKSEPVAGAEPQPEEPDDDIPELINDTQPELSQLSVANVPEIEEEIPTDPDAGSTAIQEKPENIDAVAAAATATESDENFDLDAALAIDADDTNVMQGITPNLDKLAAEEESRAPAPEAPSLDDLPTLSDSMRVDVDAEVKKAKAVMSAEAAAKEPTPSDPAPAAVAKAAAVETPEPAPELVLAPDPEIEALPAGGPAKTEAPPSPPERAQPEAPKTSPEAPSRPAPVAQVSEMTARIAMLDPDKRTDDVDALEAALSAAKKGELDRMLEATAAPQGNVPAGDVEQAEEVPEITLDEALADQVQQNEELDKFAAEIARANSLEEFSDKMAETLFGNEDLDAIAADVVANPPQADPGTPADAEPEPAAEIPDIKVDVPAPAAEKAEIASAAVVAAGEQVELSSGPGSSMPPDKGPRPDSIEDQITTSMTQNLEALDVSKMVDRVAEEDTDEPAPKKSGGLFSRFRKSS